jgi:RecA/RadA recombinase
MANKWMKQLQKLSGAVDRSYKPFNHVIRTPSPSVNFVFGNTHGLPLGYTAVIYGEPKGGKSVLANAFIGQLHRDDPDAIAVKFNTELRETGQLTDHQGSVWGIDFDRYLAYDTNQPHEIFDRIDTEINAMCQEGAPIKLIVIDSITGIVGRRAMNNTKGIMQQQIGDDALTITNGLKQILKTVRDNRIALILTTHVRAELDPNVAKYAPTKMAGSWALKHFAEYFISVAPNKSKEGRTDLAGKEFVDNNVQDMMGKGEKVGHKIRVAMKDSSVGPKGRVGEFVLDYGKGIVNVNEEIFHLVTRRGVVERTGNSYIINDFPIAGQSQKYVGKNDFATAISENEDLAKELVKRVRAQDIDAMDHGRTADLGASNMAGDEDANSPEESAIEE